jgi:hypothetical protein
MSGVPLYSYANRTSMPPFLASPAFGVPRLDLQRLAREQTMFTTRAQATGGTGTVENLADEAAMGVNPATVVHVAHGNWAGAIGSLLHAGASRFSGNTPAVRAAVGRILLRNGATLNPAQLNQMVGRTISQIQFLQTLARSGTGAAAIVPNARKSKPPIFATPGAKN